MQRIAKNILMIDRTVVSSQMTVTSQVTVILVLTEGDRVAGDD